MLWPSQAPPLAASTSQSVNTEFMSSVVSLQSHDTNVLVTAGTDMKIRFWDLQNFSSSFVVAAGGNEPVTGQFYKSRVIEATEVIYEVKDKPPQGAPTPSKKEGRNDSKPIEASQGHLNWISGLTMCQGASNWYIVSGSRDGVIKVWR